MKRAKWILLGIVLLAVAYGVFNLAAFWFEEFRRTHPQWREAYLNQSVRGYITEEEIADASLKVTAIAYFGGFLREVDYQQGKLTCRERSGMPGSSLQETEVTMNPECRRLLSDVFNLICKQKLWNQGDELPSSPVCDGGEVSYQFTVGSHQGRFKIVNTDPRHLDLFRHKCLRLIEACKPSGK